MRLREGRVLVGWRFFFFIVVVVVVIGHGHHDCSIPDGGEHHLLLVIIVVLHVLVIMEVGNAVNVVFLLFLLLIQIIFIIEIHHPLSLLLLLLLLWLLLMLVLLLGLSWWVVVVGWMVLRVWALSTTMIRICYGGSRRRTKLIVMGQGKQDFVAVDDVAVGMVGRVWAVVHNAGGSTGREPTGDIVSSSSSLWWRRPFGSARHQCEDTIRRC